MVSDLSMHQLKTQASAPPAEEEDDLFNTIDASQELHQNLPQLIQQLKLLRTSMEANSNAFQSFQTNKFKKKKSRHSAEYDQNSQRSSIFTLNRDTMTDFSASNGSIMNSYDSIPNLNRGISHSDSEYTVVWVSGECGISLRHYTQSEKTGAQIAVLQQANGVTTGIAMCRLGDYLLSINGDNVENLKFKDIVHLLKTTHRPISLRFQSNQSIQTSPRGGTVSLQYTTSRQKLAASKKPKSFKQLKNGISSELKQENGYDPRFSYSTKSYMLPVRDEHYGNDSEDEYFSRGTSSTTTSSVDNGTSSPLNPHNTTITSSIFPEELEEIEALCQEQEQVHNNLLVLLTETVIRCEQLQQENRDQMENLMQLKIPSLPSTTSTIASGYPKDN